MAINSNSNRGKKTYSFYRQRPVVNENFDDANRMAKTYFSIRKPDLTAAEEVLDGTFIATESDNILTTESGDTLVVES